MTSEGQIVTARRPEHRASGIGSGRQLSAYLIEDPAKMSQKIRSESDRKRDIEN